MEELNGLDDGGQDVFSELITCLPDTGGIEELQIDYSKLFVGPYELLAPPYGSLYLEDNNTTMGLSTNDVTNKYLRAGLAPGIREAPDHIAMELEFMYFLIFKEIEEQVSSNIGKIVSFQNQQRDFLGMHLGMWISDFAIKVIKHAETKFYRNLVEITASFIKEDMEYLHSIINDTEKYQ